VFLLADFQQSQGGVETPVGSIGVHESRDDLELGLRFALLILIEGSADALGVHISSPAAEEGLTEGEGGVGAVGRVWTISGILGLKARKGEIHVDGPTAAEGDADAGGKRKRLGLVPGQLLEVSAGESGFILDEVVGAGGENGLEGGLLRMQRLPGNCRGEDLDLEREVVAQGC